MFGSKRKDANEVVVTISTIDRALRQREQARRAQARLQASPANQLDPAPWFRIDTA